MTLSKIYEGAFLQKRFGDALFKMLKKFEVLWNVFEFFYGQEINFYP